MGHAKNLGKGFQMVTCACSCGKPADVYVFVIYVDADGETTYADDYFCDEQQGFMVQMLERGGFEIIEQSYDELPLASGSKV